jgi:hypothetical protein
MVLKAMAISHWVGMTLFAPILQGLAIPLMTEEVASLLIRRPAVSLLYLRARQKNQKQSQAPLRKLFKKVHRIVRPHESKHMHPNTWEYQVE